MTRGIWRCTLCHNYFADLWLRSPLRPSRCSTTVVLTDICILGLKKHASTGRRQPSQVMAATPLLKFEMLPTAKRPQMDASEALTWERSRDATLHSVSFGRTYDFLVALPLPPLQALLIPAFSHLSLRASDPTPKNPTSLPQQPPLTPSAQRLILTSCDAWKNSAPAPHPGPRTVPHHRGPRRDPPHDRETAESPRRGRRHRPL